MVILMLWMQGCSPLRHLDEEDAFLEKQKVIWPDSENDAIAAEAFVSGMRIAPNSTFLGVRIPMRLHGLIRREALEESAMKREERGKPEGGIRWWLSQRIGEAPARFDAQLVERTALNIEFICKQMGHLNAACSVQIDTVAHKTIHVTYGLDPGMLWTVGQVLWSNSNAYLSSYDWKANSGVQVGDAFDVEALELERNRIAQDLRNLGYASVQASHVVFLADTAAKSQSGEVQLEIQVAPNGLLGDGNPRLHKQARFGKVSWIVESTESDSLLRPEVVEFLTSIEEGMRFNERAMYQTQRRLTELPCIARVDIPGAFNGMEEDERVYDVDLILHPAKRYGMTTSLDMTRTDARYGPILSWSLMDRLAGRRGDEWDIHVSGGLTSTRPFTYSSDYLIPNSATWSVEAHYSTLGIPPLSLTRLRPSNGARADFAFNWSRQKRPEYAQNSLVFKWGFHFTENPQRKSEVRVDLLEFRRLKIENERTFQIWLDEQANPYLTARFQDYASLLSRADWKTDWSIRRHLSGTFRIQAEWTGWALGRLANARGWETNSEGQRLIGNIPFAHYFRTEAEWIWGVQDRRVGGFSWHGRIRSGYALNGSNFNGIPFDRSFFAGGANGLRGWTARDLGPGFGNPGDFDSGIIAGLGDVQGECSFEARKALTQVLEMAVFSDGGNVWLENSGATESEEDLRFNWQSIAWGAGLGMRLDFDFFVFRLDGALRIHDPSGPEGQRWLAINRLNGAVHLGIGYPF